MSDMRFGLPPDAGKGNKKSGKFNFQWDSKKRIIVLSGLISIALVASVYQFIVVPKVKTDTREATIAEVDINALPKTPVVVVKEGARIEKYTLLTTELVQQNFEVIEVPMTMAISDAAPGVEWLEGYVTESTLIPGSQVSTSLLTDQADWFGDYDRLREFEVTNTVAGLAQVGNIVDIVVEYGNGDYDVVAAKKKITGTKGQITVGQTSSSQPVANVQADNVMVFSVDEKEYANLTMAKEIGDLAIRIYIDETQEPSAITFNAVEGMAKAQASGTNSSSDGGL